MKASTTFETEEGGFLCSRFWLWLCLFEEMWRRVLCLEVRIVNESLKGETDCENGECVKERREERYCCRAGVMSRNEGEEEEILFVWTVFLCLKALLLSRATVVREGMSVSEERVMRSTLQSDGTRITECTTDCISCECSEFRQVYSSLHLCKSTSHYQFTWFTTIEKQCTLAKSNGSQFRQI